MSTLKFTKYKHYLYEVKMYVSDVPFTKDNLPTTVYQFHDINDNDLEVNIDYATMKYVMFRAENGYGDVTFGDLLNINVLEDFICPTGQGDIMCVNSAFQLSNYIELDGRVCAVCRQRTNNTIISLVYNEDNLTFDLIAFDGDTNSVRWIKQNITQYAPEWNQLTSNVSWYNYQLEIHNGFLYILINNCVFIVDANGGDLLIADGTIPVGYTTIPDLSTVYEPTDEITITKFIINDDNSSLYLVTNYTVISKLSKNPSHSNLHFHKAMTTPNPTYMSIEDHSYRDVYQASPYKDKILIVCAMREELRLSDIRDVLVVVDVDNNTATRFDTVINPTSGSYAYRALEYKHGKFYIGYNTLDSNYDSYLTTHFIIYDVNTEAVIINREFNKFTDGYGNVFLAYALGVCDDQETVYISSESGLKLYNIIRDELYSYEPSDGVRRNLTIYRNGGIIDLK